MITFNKNSWHCRLATVYNMGTPHSRADLYTDLCSYVTAVITSGLFLLIMLVFGGVLIGVPTGELIAWIAALVTIGFVQPTPTAMSIPIIFAIISSGYLIYKAYVLIKKHQDVMHEKSAFNNFIVESWKSFRERTCVRIEIK